MRTRNEAILYIYDHPEMYVYAGPASRHGKHPQEWCLTRAQTGRPRGTGATLEAALEDLIRVEGERELL